MPISIRNLTFAAIAVISVNATAVERCEMLDKMPDGEPQMKCDSYPCPPLYPAAAVRDGASGTVVLLLTVSAAGSADSVSVETSSKNNDLDEAAIRAAKRLTFPLYRPSTSSRAQCYRALFPIDFVRE